MIDDKAIKVEELGICYNMPSEPIAGTKDFFVKAISRKIKINKFWALKNVSFELERGSSIGIMGRNGAGKSTLLKVIAGVLSPKVGRVIVAGKVFPMLELGAGFNLDLTGLENIYLYGNILGFSNEDLSLMYNEIVEFSELQSFIHMPVRTYSTGMVARLAFSIATSRKPDILLADEILSVGDVAFREKCMKRMNGYLEDGTTILFVSHSADSVKKICKKGLWLEHGQVKMFGDAEEVADSYDAKY